MQSETRFSAPWGIRLFVMTGFSLLLFLGLPVAFLIAGALENSELLPLAALTLAVALAFLVWVARGHLIAGYVVSRAGLVVRRPGPETRFDLAELRSLEIDPEAMRWTYAMLNGGLFSFGGKGCRNRRLGWYDAYATDPGRSVVLRFPDRVVVVTPDDPHAFVAAIHAVLPSSSTEGRSAFRWPGRGVSIRSDPRTAAELRDLRRRPGGPLAGARRGPER